MSLPFVSGVSKRLPEELRTDLGINIEKMNKMLITIVKL